MANNLTTDTVELERIGRQTLVSRWESLQRLKENKDFQNVVLEGYLRDKAIEFTSMLGTEYVRQGGLRNAVFEELVAISLFESYMQTIDSLGAPADDEDEDDVDTIEG